MWDFGLAFLAGGILGWAVTTIFYQTKLSELHRDWETGMEAIRDELRVVQGKIK